MLLDAVLCQPLAAISPTVWMVVIVLTIIAAALIYYDRLYRKMEERQSRIIHNHNNRLALILQTEKTNVWIYYVKTRRYRRMSTDGKLDALEYTPIDFSRFFNRDDFEEMRNEIFAVRDGKKVSVTLQMRGPSAEAGTVLRRYEVKVSVDSRDESGTPLTIMGIQRDITYEKKQREREREKLLTYQTIFNSSLVDMVFYDENGILTDVNDLSAQSFHIADKQALIEANQHISEMTSFDNIDLDNVEQMRCTALLDMTRLDEEGRKSNAVGLQGKLYYDLMLFPVRDDFGELLGLFMEGRNMTDMVETIKLQQQSMRDLQQATEDVRNYIDNINMALQMADCRIMNYIPDTHTLQITSDLTMPQYELSQIRSLDLIDPSYRMTARRILHLMDHRTMKSINTRLKTIFHEQDGESVWLTFNGVPVHDSDGNITHYFGMSRNDTKLVRTEKRLKAETRKAQESESLKNSFLQNMSYEIRIPLNTVLGFAELFEREHGVEDELIFVDEIKKNSNKLLALVNDILYISRIDAHMIEVKKQETDFAASFVTHCHMGWSSNTNTEIKTIVENPYEHLNVVIDDELLGKVIENLIDYAVASTNEGMVRAKYEYRAGNLNITIDDTGVGIEAHAISHLFDRFYRYNDQLQSRTGLVLPIVKGLIDLMEGSIEINSEPGKGTTMWVSIPCELVSSEKKKEFI